MPILVPRQALANRGIMRSKQASSTKLSPHLPTSLKHSQKISIMLDLQLGHESESGSGVHPSTLLYVLVRGGEKADRLRQASLNSPGSV